MEKYKILVATTCLPEEEITLLPEWIANFKQIQYVPEHLENYIAKVNTEITNPQRIKNLGRKHIVETALQNNVDWVLFLDINLKAEIDIVIRFLKANYPFVVGLIGDQKVIMVAKEIFEKVDLQDEQIEDADEYFINQIEQICQIKPQYIELKD